MFPPSTISQRLLRRQIPLKRSCTLPKRYISRTAPRYQQLGPFADSEGAEDHGDSGSGTNSTLFKMFESAATTFASVAVLGLAGYAYHKYYKWLVLRKMENSFKPGDPVLDMASGTHSPGGVGKIIHPDDDNDYPAVASEDSSEHWVQREEQTRIDQILSGQVTGHYHLLIGEKGTGKSSMLIEAMRKVEGEGISMFEAHADLEIFRIRLGKALDFEFHEDYIGSLFSIRGPRDTTALLDIERAFNKLEKIALKRKHSHQRAGQKPRPLVLVVNCVHLIRDDDDGRDLLEVLQQRAEAWAAANLVTMVFNSDDYWVYERFKRYSTRMEVLPILDLPQHRAIAALSQYRHKYYPQNPGSVDVLTEVYKRVGGRLSYLSRVAKSKDMLSTCDAINRAEKTWFLNKCWILGESMDDDVMDDQKYSSAAMVLAKALVEKEREDRTNDLVTHTLDDSHRLPSIPLHIARQIMTRADFIKIYDHDNIFTIDSNAMVRADSVPMMNAFREICTQPGFNDYLEDTLNRIAAIESLNRTREITLKDLWTEQSGDLRGRYEFLDIDASGKVKGKREFGIKPPADD